MVTLPPLYLCTHAEVGLSIVFRCFGDESKVFQVYPSLYEDKLKGIPGLSVCCSDACCSAAGSQDASTNETATLSTETKDSDETHYNGAFIRTVWGSTEFYSSPHFWTAIVVLLLVCFMIIQNVYSYKRASRVLPILERETSGPFSSTREGNGGIILPNLVYSEKQKSAPNHPSRPSDQIKQRSVVEILSASDLLALECELDQDQSDTKILSDTESTRVYTTQKRNTRTQRILKIQLFDPAGTERPAPPLLPPLQPSPGLMDNYDLISLNHGPGLYQAHDHSSIGSAPASSLSTPRLLLDSSPASSLPPPRLYLDLAPDSALPTPRLRLDSDEASAHPSPQTRRSTGRRRQQDTVVEEDEVAVSYRAVPETSYLLQGDLCLLESREPATLPNQVVDAPNALTPVHVLSVHTLDRALTQHTGVGSPRLPARRSADRSILVPEPVVTRTTPPPSKLRRGQRRFSLEYPGLGAAVHSPDAVSLSLGPEILLVPSVRTQNEYSVDIPDPLVPAYHPNRRVSGVWRDENSMDRLYRYTNMDRLVYPPGYIT